MYKRNKTRPVKVGNVTIGGENKVVVQSMCTTRTSDIEATVKQINSLKEAGCQIVRLAVLNDNDADAIKDIKNKTNIPLVADIHFNHELAIKCIDNGIDKIRINPGNIGSIDNVKQVVSKCKEKNIPIRIGINSGSIEQELIDKYGKVTSEAMVESLSKHIDILENLDFYDIVISLKASSIQLSLEAYKLAASKYKYPMHIGITESGTKFTGTIKSSIGLGLILQEGIGDTMRVSLSSDPIDEIDVAEEILNNFNLIDNKIKIISCPTCGRLQINMLEILDRLEPIIRSIKKDIKVAIMGCVVNGPGEAKEANIALCCSYNTSSLYVDGKLIKKVKTEDIEKELLNEIKRY